ncbi:MAG: two-component system response regulator [Desulfosarcinaceae bacterium]
MENGSALANILVVDDDPAVQRMMKRILGRSGYHVLVAGGGQAAFDMLNAGQPDLIMLDLSMPNIDGFQVATQLKGDLQTREIPIILITGLDSSQNHVRALDLGVNDFLSKTAQPEEILARIRSHLKIKQLNDELRDYRLSLEKMVALRTDQLKDASLEVIWRLTAASEYRDNETGAHIQRMSHYSAAIARKMGLAPKTVETILYAAPMHDIGKIGIPDRILLKPGKLDAAEWEIMKDHTIIGANILKGSKIGFVRMGAMISMTHHEKWDGSGYPYGLKGRCIPLAGRIVALADVFDALTSNRPYKEAFPVETAYGIIEKGRGNHFDPQVVEAFFSIHDELMEIKEKFRNEKLSPMMTLDCMFKDGGAVSLLA